LERTFAQGGVTGQSLVAGNLLFSVARGEDDADIRRLFRENALGGWVRLSLEREPNAFDADFGLSRSHAFIIARDRETGEAIGICERSVRDAFVDGEIRPLPYFGSLRVTPARRHRIRVLRGGFAAVRSLLGEPSDLPFALTSITADNAAARPQIHSSSADSQCNGSADCTVAVAIRIPGSTDSTTTGRPNEAMSASAAPPRPTTSAYRAPT